MNGRTPFSTVGHVDAAGYYWTIPEFTMIAHKKRIISPCFNINGCTWFISSLEIFVCLKEANISRSSSDQKRVVQATVSIEHANLHSCVYDPKITKEMDEIMDSFDERGWVSFIALKDITPYLIKSQLVISIRIKKETENLLTISPDIPRNLVPKLEHFAGSPEFHDVIIRVINCPKKESDEPSTSTVISKKHKHKIDSKGKDTTPIERLFYGHKVVLASASVWFKNLFTSGMSESSGHEITIRETDPGVFEKILMLIYTSNFEAQDVFEALSISKAADEFQLHDICNQAFSYLQTQVTRENLWLIWNHAELLENEDVQNFCQNYLRRNCIACLQSSAWEDLEALWAIRTLQIDKLTSNVKEVDFYRAALRWRDNKQHYLAAKNESGDRSGLRLRKRAFQQLRDCEDERQINDDFSKMIHCIRFPQMDMQYLVTNVETDVPVMNVSGINELASIYYFFSSYDSLIIN
ncbi:hypothetical protein J3Q64DRAFT_1872044 [Phycomyces blakesleeanus]|uniref:BTB domain-containing protein n=2 Tax=Phycomyces blakesleeanus TaxID=4837 RepID=A0A162UF42_PHYB8|nr:hypothetical protein PHYBLDRAFT_61272 [Phycomyces blakesleeanus NRRL 1555(-)]OAD74673.1 hypothetical protein PHYBLDRAFT_61272 [Phycomyces blakesleeanus NRRL 1555(-)]|eukprot:XP_018292713.1 hypothetical protein PHYBLDRAFT_61272 [Phycomyces blakesleeanus NRRL 1555(-)]